MANSTPADGSQVQQAPLIPFPDRNRLDAAPPVPLTSFIGREREVAAITCLLQHDGARLVTLTGPGGVGKTRLALHVAEGVEAAFPDGVWFVGLAPLANPDLVIPTVAQVLSIREAGRESLSDRLNAFLRDKRLLLVLDNFEHVIDAAPTVANLLRTCLEVTVVITSRVRLRLSGEREYMVPPLSLDRSDDVLSSADVAKPEAMRLFVERAQAVRQDFTITAANFSTVAEICRRLDGLPLAIELVTAWMKVLSPMALLARLEKRLPLLTGGGRDLPARQQTMRDTIAWSHDLLSPEERVLFRQLGVFAGGCTLDAAEAVACGTVDPGWDVLDGVASLVDKSLLWVEDGPGGDSRYVMLETIREYALERLAESDDECIVRQSHASYFAALADQAQMILFLPDGGIMAQRLEADLPNFRVCIAWIEKARDAERLLRLMGALFIFLALRGRSREGRIWLERAVALGRAQDSPALAAGLVALAAAVHLRGDEPSALALAEEGLSLARATSDHFSVVRGLTTSGLVSLRLYDLDRAATFQEEALAALPALGDAIWVRLMETSILGHLGNIAVALGDVGRADALFTAALDQQRALGYEFGTSHIAASHPIAGLGDVARARGDHALALSWYQDALGHAWSFRDARAVAYALGGTAGTLAAAGRWEEAARLFGASEALHERAGLHFDLETMNRQRALGLPEPWQRAGEPFDSGQPLREAIKNRGTVVAPVVPDPELAAQAWEDGRSIPLVEAITKAISAAIPAIPPADSVFGLTPREREVLTLLTEGRSNQAIADTLFISPRTAKNHVAHILAKLGANSRAAAVAYALRHDLA